MMSDVKVENKTYEQQRNQPGTQRTGGSIIYSGEQAPGTRGFFTNPFSIMRRLTEEMDRAFSTSWGLGREMGAWWPAVEVKERDGNLMVYADLPGLHKEDVKVEVNDEGLVIRGERKTEHDENQLGFHRSERSYGQFYRAIPLPEGAQPDKAQAQFKEGVLEVKLPLAESARHHSKEIPIKT